MSVCDDFLSEKRAEPLSTSVGYFTQQEGEWAFNCPGLLVVFLLLLC